MDKYKVAIVDDDEVALENLSFELGKDARFFFLISATLLSSHDTTVFLRFS